MQVVVRTTDNNVPRQGVGIEGDTIVIAGNAVDIGDRVGAIAAAEYIGVVAVADPIFRL